MKAHRHRVTIVLEIDVPAPILYTRGYVREIVDGMVAAQDDVHSYEIKDIDDQKLKVVTEIPE